MHFLPLTAGGGGDHATCGRWERSGAGNNGDTTAKGTKEEDFEQFMIRIMRQVESLYNDNYWVMVAAKITSTA